MIMFRCTYSLLLYFKEQYYNAMKNVERVEIAQIKRNITFTWYCDTAIKS